LDISGKKIDEICPCCLVSTHWMFLYYSKYQDYNLPIYLCTNCKLQTLFPKIDPIKEEMYEEGYYLGSADFKYIDERKNEKFNRYVWKARLKNIMKFVSKGNFLDVGSSFGGFLEEAKRFGFVPYGVELSKYSSKYSIERGIETFTGDYLENRYPLEFFDVITMVEVIEHLMNPIEVFQKLYNQLKSNGLLLIQTANFEGLQAINEGKNYHYYLPGHLYYYSKTNLEKILIQTGFSKIKMYYGVDFPLSAKLMKSRGNFINFRDYLKWIQISKYHIKSKLFPGSTSSMVIYAIK
jgi:2-polyprenyl-3-methyl-5-hydroxy-6-metoxy-1,4-benzoquinol methylase